MANTVSSLIFAYRNADKTSNGEVGRAPVMVGQATNVFNEVMKWDNVIGAGAKSANSIFSDMSKSNNFMKYTSKGLKFASENVNPLICGSALLKIGMSDDKPRTAIVETAALSGMFLGEGLMKIHLDKYINEKNINNLALKAKNKNCFKGLADKILTSKSGGKIANVIRGLIFVGGSIGSYALGEKLGEKYADNLTGKLGIKKINQKA